MNIGGSNPSPSTINITYLGVTGNRSPTAFGMQAARHGGSSPFTQTNLGVAEWLHAASMSEVS